MKKTFSKLQGNILNLIKGIFKKNLQLTSNLMVKDPTPKVENKSSTSILITSFQQCTESPSHGNNKKK